MANYMRFTSTLGVHAIERLRNSRNGGPRYRFLLYNGMEMKTPTDAGWVYGLVPSAITDTTIRVHYRTKRGGYEILGIA